VRLPLRRIAFGFALGAAAGWLAGLLRTPAAPPAGSSADEAMRLPQQDFGDPAGEPAPAETTVEAEYGTADIAQESTAPPAEPKKPARKRAPRKVAADTTAEATESILAAAAEATERLDVAAAEATPAPEPPTPASRRRRRPAPPVE
jgi:hypothetical protein